MAKCLIAGCGQLGQRIAKQLLEQSHEVWALRRQTNSLPAAWQTICADLSDPNSLQALPTDLDYVFYTAAADQYTEQSYQQTYINGVKNLLTALQTQQSTLPRFFFTSSTAVYAQSQGEWVDEQSDTKNTLFSGQAMLAAEKIVAQSNCPSTIVRLSGIYGPGRVRLINSVKEGIATLSSQDIFTNRIHIDDATRVFLHLMSPQFSGETFIGTDCLPALKNDVIHYLAGLLGKEVSQFTVDDGKHPMRGNKRCSNKKLLASRFVFEYPSFKEGYAGIINCRAT